MHITRNFTTDEMACSCCGKSDMDDEFIDTKKIVNRVKEYQLSVTFFKNKQLWEEYDG